MTKEDALTSFKIHNAIKDSDIESDALLQTMSGRIDAWLKSVDTSDHELFLRMVGKYNYITHRVAIHRYAEAVEQLKTQVGRHGILPRNILFITNAQRDTKRGSHNVITDLHERTIASIDAEQIIFSNARSIKKRLRAAHAIVFVDDIVSTGYTLWSMIYDFLKRLDAQALLEEFIAKKCFFICIVPTKTGLRYVTKQCKNIKLRITPIRSETWETRSAFKPDYIFAENEKDVVAAKIKKYEELISNDISTDGKCYVFGFEQRKQLISFYYNTPNNTLCNFWAETSKHSPLFKRQNQPTPTVSDLEGIKRRKDNAAYQRGIEKQRRIREIRENETAKLTEKISAIYQQLDEEHKLDNLDCQLVGYLNEHPSASYPQIAKDLECTKDIVDFRVQKLFNKDMLRITAQNRYIVTEKAADAISHSYNKADNNESVEFDSSKLYIPDTAFID